jgi:hypothetical protein
VGDGGGGMNDVGRAWKISGVRWRSEPPIFYTPRDLSGLRSVLSTCLVSCYRRSLSSIQ